MPWIYNTFLEDDAVDVEYQRYPGDESVGVDPEYEFWVYNEAGQDITDQLTYEQTKQIYKECKEHYVEHQFDYDF